VADASHGGLVRSAALIGGEGELLAASPDLEWVQDPIAAPACKTCHRAGTTRPDPGPVAAGGLIHVFQPRAVGQDHLYMAFNTELLSRGEGDLPLLFVCGLLAMLVLLIVLWLTLRSLVLVPAQRLVELLVVQGRAAADESLAGVFSAVTRDSIACAGVEEDLRRIVASWESSNAVCFDHLEELKRDSQSTLEIGQRILDSAHHLSDMVEDFGRHLDGISASTTDNSTSLIQMSASVDEVAGSSDQLSQYVLSTAGSVEQMVKSIGEVADRVETLAQETDTTAASMANIDASTREIEVNARQADTLSGRMAQAARDGSLAVEETLRGIHSSYGVIQETARAMDELQEAFLAVGSVVKIINEINDKTKLLALNAAIIAAQAGEHGKSFAVVAHEIKNLSDRTASSTGQISHLIKAIRGRMSAAAEAVARGEGATGSSVELAERAGEALQHIRDTAQVSHDMTRDILHATEEQSRGSQKVMASMQEVNAMVNYIRQAAGEHRSNGEAVAAQTGFMRELTEQVKHATAEQAEVSRYISDAIAAVDRNLQTMVDAVESKRRETLLILKHAGELRERGRAEAHVVLDVEESLTALTAQIGAVRKALRSQANCSGGVEG
jgi:methyl-accepting chemotaxis protein